MATDVAVHQTGPESTTATPSTAVATPRNRWLSDWFDFQLPDLFRWFDERRPGLFGTEDRIRVEEEMADGVLHIRAEAPGIDPEKDADISVEDGVVRLKIQRRQESRSEEEGRVRSEFHYGSFYRTIPLPKGVDSSQIHATYKDGILEVTVPMPEPTSPPAQKVNVSRS